MSIEDPSGVSHEEALQAAFVDANSDGVAVTTCLIEPHCHVPQDCSFGYSVVYFSRDNFVSIEVIGSPDGRTARVEATRGASVQFCKQLRFALPHVSDVLKSAGFHMCYDALQKDLGGGKCLVERKKKVSDSSGSGLGAFAPKAFRSKDVTATIVIIMKEGGNGLKIKLNDALPANQKERLLGKAIYDVYKGDIRHVLDMHLYPDPRKLRPGSSALPISFRKEVGIYSPDRTVYRLSTGHWVQVSERCLEIYLEDPMKPKKVSKKKTRAVSDRKFNQDFASGKELHGNLPVARITSSSELLKQPGIGSKIMSDAQGRLLFMPELNAVFFAAMHDRLIGVKRRESRYTALADHFQLKDCGVVMVRDRH